MPVAVDGLIASWANQLAMIHLRVTRAASNNGTASDPVVGLKGPNGDQYLYAHTQYDIQGSYRLFKRLSLVGYGLNLSNEVFGFYQGDKLYPIQREFYHPTVSFGLRWTSSPE